MSKVLDQVTALRRLYGFWQSRVILTANNFRVFDHLKYRRSAAEIAAILGTDRRATERLLDALAGLALLKKSASGYKNSAMSNRFLISESPYYQGDIIRHNDTLWKNWSGLDEVLQTGIPHHAAHDQNSFIKGMHNIAVLKAKEVIGAIGLKAVKKALDLGGGPGTYAMELAKKGVSVTLFDRPETIEIATGIIKSSGAKNIRFIKGDFLKDDIGSGYDLVFISQVLHSCSEDDCLKVIKKSKAALNRRGRIVIQEFAISADMITPAQSALFSINMLVNTPAGRCYSSSEIREWLLRAGLRHIRENHMDDTVLVSGGLRG